MNQFEITGSRNPNEDQNIKLKLSEAIHDSVIDTLKELWLIPILQGTKTVLDDGSTEYSFKLSFKDSEILKDMILQAMTKFSGYNLPN